MAEPRKVSAKLKAKISLARDFVPYWCRKLLGLPKDPDPKKRTTFDEGPAKLTLMECIHLIHGEKVSGLMERFVNLPLEEELGHLDRQIVKLV